MQLKQKPNPSPPNPSDLEDFIGEASEVNLLTHQKGWQILSRDLVTYREDLIKKLAYINPKRPEFNEIRILFLATDKLMSMVGDYKENRTRAIELLEKIQNPDLVVPLDMDTEISPNSGQSEDGY